MADLTEQYPSRSAFRGAATRAERVRAGLASAAILALFALMLLRLGVLDSIGRGAGDRLVSVSLSAEGRKASAQKSAAAKPAHQAVQMPAQPMAVRPKIAIAKTTTPRAAEEPFKLIPLSHADMDSSDISKLGKSGDGDSGDSGSGGAGNYGPGEGPQGQRLYNAEWFREPTSAELSGYMGPKSAAGEWAMIACRTIENHHVDNCQEIDEAPRGSGLARALRQAAWQFLVRPPRIGGKPQIGAWVRIRFDFIRGKAD